MTFWTCMPSINSRAWVTDCNI